MAEPWVKRNIGELLTSAAWNDMQSQARDELLAVDKKIAAAITRVENKGLEGQDASARVHVAYMKPGAEGTPFDGGQWSGGGVKLTGNGFDVWRAIPTPSLSLSLTSRCHILLRAEAYSQFSTDYGGFNHLLLQFILKQGSKRAPARVDPSYIPSSSSYTYKWPGELTAQSWQAWLDYHDACYQQSTGFWPVGGPNRAVNFALGTAVQNDCRGPVSLEESIELPPGEFEVQVGFATRRNNCTLSAATLRAIVVPM